jgi:hypothetical protein
MVSSPSTLIRAYGVVEPFSVRTSCSLVHGLFAPPMLSAVSSVEQMLITLRIRADLARVARFRHIV